MPVVFSAGSNYARAKMTSHEYLSDASAFGIVDILLQMSKDQDLSKLYVILHESYGDTNGETFITVVRGNPSNINTDINRVEFSGILGRWKKCKLPNIDVNTLACINELIDKIDRSDSIDQIINYIQLTAGILSSVTSPF